MPDKNKAKPLELRDLIAKLRDELQGATDDGEGQPIKFKVDAIELELKVVAKQTGEGKTGVKFWIANADVSGKIEDEHTQTVKLKLVPQMDPPNDGSSAVQSTAGNREVLISDKDKNQRG